MRQIVEEKSLIKSKTFWVNLIAIVIAVLTFLLDHELVKDNVQLIQVFATIVGALNIVLRLLTTQPVRMS